MRTVLCFVLIYAAFDRTAALLGSSRGEWGWAVCVLVVGLCLLAERWLTGARPAHALHALGLRASRAPALVAAALITCALLACVPMLAGLLGVDLTLLPGAAWLALGMLAQGGIAEEVLFRGFMYRHLRRTRSFWRAASLSAVPFAAVHVPLFWTLEPSVAAVALLLALASACPLAWLFDRSGGSIWPGAVVHAAIQAGIKLLANDAAGFQRLAIAWVVLCAVLPWSAFLLRRRGSPSPRPPASSRLS